MIYSLDQVADMKAEYIPPREDVIMQNEAADDVYIIVSGEVEIISCEMDKERVVSTLRSGDMFGEVGAFSCRPQCFTYRTKILSQLLRLKTSALFEAIKTRHEDNITMIKNFLQVSFQLISSYLQGRKFFLSVIVYFQNMWIRKPSLVKPSNFLFSKLHIFHVKSHSITQVTYINM